MSSTQMSNEQATRIPSAGISRSGRQVDAGTDIARFMISANAAPLVRPISARIFAPLLSARGNLDSKTGKPVKLTDILKPGALEQLTSMAESRFRDDHQLSATENLSEHSFGFPGDRFHLNDNYGIGDTALVFHFNPYEIGPGAMGDTEITISYAEMRHLLKPGSGLLR
jgi:Protein of unknown function (DUF3298)